MAQAHLSAVVVINHARVRVIASRVREVAHTRKPSRRRGECHVFQHLHDGVNLLCVVPNNGS
jgi:hypothetical protein